MDSTIGVAIIAAVPPTLAVALAYLASIKRNARTDRKLEVIRIDVNSNLHAALEKIGRFERHLGLGRGEEPLETPPSDPSSTRDS